ncbi:hypothetical protein N7488_005991 [Penicillium malachiteum]|nr:hypothetical protein N7488_005991 [Penicillium malachiteum]
MKQMPRILTTSLALSNLKQTGQFQRIFGVLEDRTKAIIQEHNANFQSLQVVGDLSTKLVSDAAKLSYVTLEEVVHTLLQIENGKTRLSRENSSILDLLHTTVEKFQDICGTSKHSAADIGLEAEACMRLGDNAHRFLGDLADAMRTLNIESAAIWKVKEQEVNSCNDDKNRRQQLQDRLNSANDDRDVR